MHLDSPWQLCVRPRARACAVAAAALLSTAALLAPAQEFVPPPIAEPTAPAIPASEVVAEVRIVGNDTTSASQIASHITTRVGRPFDRSVVQQDVRKLASLAYFVDVKSLDEVTPQGRIVIFQVVERPTIRYLVYLGNDGQRDKTLGKQTGLKEGGSVDPYSVEEGRRKMLEHYASKGYNNAQVTIREGNQATDQGVAYVIHEGQSQRIWKVRFIGNEFASDSRLKHLIKSKRPILYLFKGYLDRELIDADVDLLTAYYRSFGFFQARIGRQIEYNDKGNWADLTFVIDEGMQYQVRDVRFLGNTKFQPAPLAENVKLKGGESFEQGKMLKDAKWLQELYGSHGYVFANVRPETVYLEEPGEVDLVYHIDEGKRWRVGRIIVHIGGDNPHTRIQTALNRCTVIPGEIMDIRELHASERRLLHSSLFHIDPATNQRPKITFQIPDDEDMGLADDGPGDGGVRGQSPVAGGPPLLAPPSVIGALSANVSSDSPAAGPADMDPADGMDVHVYCEDEAHYARWQAAELTRTDPESIVAPREEPTAAAPQNAPPVEQRVEPPAEVVIRGQSPAPA